MGRFARVLLASLQGARFSCSALLVAGLGCTLSGCPDPAGKFDEFAQRVKKEPVVEPDGGTECPVPEGGLPTPEQLSGTFLLAVATAVDLTRPFVYLLEVETELRGDRYILSMRDRPLSAKDRKTPVAEFGEVREFEVAPGGCFESDPVEFSVPAEANPVISLPTVSLLTLKGNVADALRDDDGLVRFWCGEINGDLVEPFKQNVDGSTFAAMRITDPDVLPDIFVNCAMQPAKEL